jgi:hypothetical protein
LYLFGSFSQVGSGVAKLLPISQLCVLVFGAFTVCEFIWRK